MPNISPLTPHEILAAQVKGNVDDPLFKALWERCPECQSNKAYSNFDMHILQDNRRCANGYVLRSREEAWYRLPEAGIELEEAELLSTWQQPMHPLDALCAAISNHPVYKAKEGVKP